ncbi:T9SS type A sorting domain-containing protein [Candidatus Kapabacteria bacterium]|nr:T9SS type A sorting domain-containing protein [Candidatus Kapabacteria bacterium]
MKLIILLIIAFVSLKANDEHKKYQELLHPEPILKNKGVPKFLLNDVPTPLSSAFENINTIAEEEESLPTQNESSIAVNPTNPLQIMASAVDYREDGVRWVYLSSDGGRSWYNQNLGTVRENWRSSNDPSVAFSWDGWGYLMYGGILSTRGPNGVYLAITKDFGETWESHIPVIEHLGPVVETTPFDDKYYVEIDNSPNSPFQGNVYTPWKRMMFDDNSTQIMVARSTDRGFTWQEPVPVSQRKPDTVDDTTYGQSFPLLTTGPNGELYAFWNDGLVHGVGFNKSTDGGMTWEEPRIVQSYEIFGETKQVNNTWQHRIKDNVRAETYPVVKCDWREGETSGNLYLTWAGGEPPNIYFSRSTDQGETWIEPKMVHADTAGNDQWWQWMDIDPVTGDLAVMFMDSRNDPNNIWAETWVAYSSNQGDTWVERQISDVRSDLRRNPFQGNTFAGDYNGCAFYNGVIYPSWVDMRNTPIGGTDNDVYTGYVDINAPAVPVGSVTEMYDRVDELIINWEIEFKNSFFGNALNSEDLELRVYINNENTYKTILAGKSIDTLRGLTPFELTNIDIRLFDKTTERESGSLKLEATPGIIEKPNMPIFDSTSQTLNQIDFQVLLPSTKVDNITPITQITQTNLYRDGESVFFFDQNVEPGSKVPMGDMPQEDGYYNYSIESEVKYKSPAEKLSLSDRNSKLVYFGADRTNDFIDFEEEKKYIYSNDDWTLTNEFAKSGNYSITDSKDSNYKSSYDNYLYLPKYKRSESADPLNLVFWNAAIIRSGDKGIIQLSKDFENWSNIAEFSENDFAAWDDDVLDENDWRLENISLEEFVDQGEEFFLRLLMSSNFIGNNDGWYIDDMYVSNYPLSVENQSSFDVYPNPAKDKLYMSEGSDYQIFDIYGNLILKGRRTSKSTFIDIQNIRPGAYFIIANDNIKKFIKL